jgi:hypothetical protein
VRCADGADARLTAQLPCDKIGAVSIMEVCHLDVILEAARSLAHLQHALGL